ncbi:ABC-type transporter Mla subunit MlaD [Dysgonomonadaceae bacterium PH5-43]|nr:ABC-type transporter Mla subunit MlaD [Dysgonomonadaceae bacterium PH5-43]
MTPGMRRAYNEVVGLDKEIDKLGDTTDRVTAGMGKSFGNLGGVVGGALSFAGASAFVSKIFDIRSAFQDTESSMTVFLGSAEKASKFMRELQDYAWYNMFEFSDLTEESKKLLAFRVDVEDVISVIDQLSNIAAGVKKPLSEYVDLYTKAKSLGKLEASDIESWGQRGVVIMDTLKDMGVEVDRSSVKFEHLEMVLKNLTSTGGMFDGLMAEQMSNLSASYGQLQDDITNMFNELGEKYQDVMKSGIEVGSWLIANYEQIGRTIMELVGVYGTYRVALAAATAAEYFRYQATLAGMAGMTKMQAITDVLRAKTAALNKTMLANPYVLVAAGIAALAYGTYKLITYQTEAEKAQKRLNDALKEAEKNSLSEQRELARLKGELSALTKGTDQYNEVKDKIIKNFGKYYSGLEQEIEAVGLTEAAYNKLTEAITRSFGARQYEKFTQEQTGNLEETMSKNLGKIQDRLIDKLGEEAGTKYYTKIRNSLLNGDLGISGTNFYDISGLEDETRKALDQVSGRGNFVSNFAIEGYIREIIKAQELTDELDKKARIKFGIEDVTPSITENNSEAAKSFDNISDAVSDTTQKIEKLKKEIADLRSGDIQVESGSLTKTLEEKIKELKTAEDKLALLTGKDSKTIKAGQSALDKEKKQAQESAELRRKIANDEIREAIEKQSRELDNEQALLNIQEDGFEKRQKQAELNHKKNLLAIEKRTQELIEKQQETEKNAWKLEGEKGTFVPTTITANDLYKNNPEAKKEIDESRSTANAVYKAETDALYKELLDKYKDYARRRREVEEQFQEDIKALNELPDDNEYKADTIKEAEKQRKEAIKSINEEEASEIKKTSDLFIRLFGDASTQTVKEIRRVIDEVQALYDYLSTTSDEDLTDNFGFTAEQLRSFKGDAEQLKAILDGLIAKKKELAEKSEFEAFSQSISDALKKINKGGRENIGEGIADIGSAISGIMPSVEKFGQDIGSIFGEDTADDIKVITDLLGATVEVGTGVGKIMSGDVIGGITDVVSGLTKVFSMASEAEKRHRQALEDIASRRLDLQRQYNLLLLEQNLLLKEASTVFGEKEITKAANALKNYEETIRQLQEEMRGDAPGEFLRIFGSKEYEKQLKAYNDGIKGLQDAQIVTGHKKTGLFGWGKGKDTYSSILDVYDDVIDAEGRINTQRIQTILDTQKMNDETRAYLENLLALEEQAEAAAEALRSYLQETFGVLGEDIISSITSAIMDQGIDAWEEFGKSGAKVIEALGEQLAYELFFADKFAKLQADLEAIYSDTSDPEEIARRQMALIGNFYSTIDDEMAAAQDFLEQWKKNAADQGFDLWSDDSSSQSGKAGAFTTMTQDQAGKLEGLFTSVQNHVASMDDKMSDLSEAMYDSVDLLGEIRDNTGTAAAELKTIREDIKAIIRDGLRMK